MAGRAPTRVPRPTLEWAPGDRGRPQTELADIGPPQPGRDSSRLATDLARRHTRSMTIRDTSALIDAGLIDPSDRAAIEAVSARYAVALTPAMHALIEAPDDPIA